MGGGNQSDEAKAQQVQYNVFPCWNFVFYVPQGFFHATRFPDQLIPVHFYWVIYYHFRFPLFFLNFFPSSFSIFNRTPMNKNEEEY
jgi:hypothetical protein